MTDLNAVIERQKVEIEMYQARIEAYQSHVTRLRHENARMLEALGEIRDGLPTGSTLLDCRDPLWRDAYRELQRIARAALPRIEEDHHPDDLAVYRFATAMIAKLAQKREEGYRGWDDPESCTTVLLSGLLHEHVAKGDPVDVGNLAMMLHQRGSNIKNKKDAKA